MENSGNFHAGLVLDGYRLLRPIGAGGFGTVWLAESDASGGFHAVKIVNSSQRALERELSAVRRFREFSRTMRSPHLIAIEHVNTIGDALFYVLPLADGGPSSLPTDPEWIPDTLASRIEARMNTPAWFSSQEILEDFLPIARVVAEMNAAGVVHRDIKPSNILFFEGRPCLADIGLLDDDTQSLSVRGTPGHVPPSWYLEASGQPDMWGLATTLYSQLTGNHPDKIGRTNFRWPAQGETSLSPEEHSKWKRWHAAILRATEESPHERFLTIQSFADACDCSQEGELLQGGSPSKSRIGMVLGVIAVLIAFAVAWSWREGRGEPTVVPHNKTPGQILPTQPPTLEAAFSENITTPQISPPEIDLSGTLEALNSVKESINEASRRAEQSRSPDTR
jgi:serine/threonine protein kinase